MISAPLNLFNVVLVTWLKVSTLMMMSLCSLMTFMKFMTSLTSLTLTSLMLIPVSWPVSTPSTWYSQKASAGRAAHACSPTDCILL